jgi:membrane-bound serine protease (ClpP class)
MTRFGLKTRLFFVCVFLLISLLASAATSQKQASAEAQTGPVIVVSLIVSVDPGSSIFMNRIADYAVSQGASAVIIEMNTPGGLLTDMVSIISSLTKINQTGIPTYTYVVPNGLAASAGSYIAMATDKILMGSGSIIGPSTPIVVGGTALEQNHTQAGMLSLMTSLAQKGGRNSTAAYDMVQADQAFTASEAYQYHLIDGVANSLDEAIGKLGLSGRQETFMSESLYEQFVSALSNPLLDGVLILFGVIAIVLDIYHPTILLTITGVIAIILGLVGAEIVDASIIGFIIIAIAAVLIVLELKLGHGFAMIAGAVLGVFGILLLTQGMSYSPSPITYTTEFELALIAIVGIFAGLYIRWIIGPIRRRSKLTGPEAIIGKIGVAMTDLQPKGEVRVEGEIWRAESVIGNILRGESIRVRAIKGLILEVEKPPDTPASNMTK